MYLIYKLTFPNNKLYVGITNNFYRRMGQHKNVANSLKSNLPLYNAINKYGWNNINTEIIYNNLDKNKAVEKEMELISSLKLTQKGYNKSPGGNVPSDHHSEDMKKRHLNTEYKKRMVGFLKSNEIKRKESLRTISHRNLVGERNSRLIREGKSNLPIIKKPIICIETGERFDSITDAAKKLNGDRTHLRAHLKREKYRPRFKGFTFNYVGN